MAERAFQHASTLDHRHNQQDQLTKSDRSDIMDYSPHNPPMPETTKKAGKRRKHPFGPKQAGMRQPNPIGMIYAIGTLARVADDATEKRLSRTGPSTSTRLAGYNYIWGEKGNPCP